MSPLVQAARKALRDVADPAKAPIMQAYMKSAIPYLGIQATPLRKVARAVFSAHKIESFPEWRDTVLELWRGARYREERYIAIELAGRSTYRKFRTMDALPMYEEMITTGAWWDYVDSIASHRLGELLRLHPAKMGRVLRKWAKSDDMWKRRSAIWPSSGSRPILTWRCCTIASGRRFVRRSSSCEKRSAGRCVNSPRRTRRR